MRIIKYSFWILIITLYSCTSQQVLNSTSKWDVLLEDKDTFKYEGDANWSTNKGEICNILESGEGYFITEKKYNSFELEFEFNPDALVNSGIFVRCKNAQMSATDCYELNIWDTHPDQSNRTGSIVKRAAPKAIVHTIGKWNTMRVTAQDNRIQIWINDIQTMDYADAISRDGIIGFQAFKGGGICFRNIRIREY